MSHTKDMIEVQYGDRSAILGSYLDFMTTPELPSKAPRVNRSPRSLFSGWSSSSSESSESHDGDHRSQHQAQEEHPQTQQRPAQQEQPHDDDSHHNPFGRLSHDHEVHPFAAEFATAPRRQNHAMFSRSERRKLQRIHTWAQDVEAQTMRRPLLMDRDQPMPKYMTFDSRDRQWVFRQPYSDPGSADSSSFNSMLARFGRRRSRTFVQREREPIGWWWPWVIVVLLILVLVAVGVYLVSQQPFRDGPDMA